MIDGGFVLPKPMLVAGDKTIFEWSISSINLEAFSSVLFITRASHESEYGIREFIRNKTANYSNINIISLDEGTSGATETVFKALSKFPGVLLNKPHTQLTIFCPDVHFYPRYTPQDQDFRDGMILTFKANSPNYSYVEKGADSYLTRTAEKEVISREASVGVYCFDSIKNFYDAAAPYIASCKKTGRESHICPLYNEYISAGKKIISREIDDIHIMGTPDEFRFFEKVSFKFLSQQPRKFVLCSDHSGFRAKEMFRKFLDSKLDCHYIDIGTFSANDCDYNDYVSEACRIITTGKENYFGVGFCRSGQGVNIAANKYPGIRSCLVANPEEIRLGIEHNACNFFAVPDRVIMNEQSSGYKKDKDIFYLFYEMATTKFSGGRHQNRLMKNGDYK